MIKKIVAHIYLDTESGDDEVGSEFDNGARSALQGFPLGDVLQVDVQTVESVSDQERTERGWDDEPESPSFDAGAQGV